MASGSATLVVGRSASVDDSTPLIADGIDEESLERSYVEVREARRRNRILEVDRFDAFYKAYVTAIFVSLVVYWAVGMIGDAPFTSSALRRLTVEGPGWLGLGAALAVVIGLRSGARGGPLGFELPDVRHLIMAPVDRRRSVRRPALRYLLHIAFLAMCGGAVAGLILSQRTPEHFLLWVASGAVTFVLIAVLSASVALWASGLRLRSAWCDLLGLLLLAWAAVDVWQSNVISPFSWVASVAFWPLKWSWNGLAAAVLVALVVAVGLRVSNRASIETTERRSRLVGNLRFAATMQDLRTVMLLQRQLSQETLRLKPPRRRKALPEPAPKSDIIQRTTSTRPVLTTAPMLKRCWQGMRKWSVVRIGRVLLVSSAAGASIVAGWQGTSPMFLVAGVLMWLVALDLVEGLAQENDHPDRAQLSPYPLGKILPGLVLLPYFLVFLLTQVFSLVVMRFANPDMVRMLWPVSVVVTLCSVGGAAMVVIRRSPGASTFVETPEMASLKVLWRAGAPPAVSIMGMAPLMAASRSWNTNPDLNLMMTNMNFAFILAMGFAFFSFAYVRYADEFRKSMATVSVEQKEKARLAQEKAQIARAEKDRVKGGGSGKRSGSGSGKGSASKGAKGSGPGSSSGKGAGLAKSKQKAGANPPAKNRTTKRPAKKKGKKR